MATPRKRVAPKPARKSEAVEVREDFTRDVGGVTITLPSLSYLSPFFLRRCRGMGDNATMWFIIENSCNAKQLDVIDCMDRSQWDEMVDAWYEHSGITLGES